MACEGMIPMTTIYSSFLQRGYDQVVHDVALQNLPGKALGPVMCCCGVGGSVLSLVDTCIQVYAQLQSAMAWMRPLICC